MCIRDSFSGVVLSDVESNLNNPSGATVALTVTDKSDSLSTASVDADGDLTIALTGLTANATATVTVQAAATIGGVARTAEQEIDLNLTAGQDTSDFITAGDVPVTESDIENFITIGDVPVTSGDIPSTAGFITIGDVPDIPPTAVSYTHLTLPTIYSV